MSRSHRPRRAPLPLIARRDPLPALVHLTLDCLPGCDAASIAVLRVGAPLAVAASDLTVRWLTELQYRQARGPSWDATGRYRMAVVDDIAAAARHRNAADWLSAAHGAGLAATIAMPIPTADDAAAVLNVYTRRLWGWPADATATAWWLAAYVGESLSAAEG